jgi:hypothetical protein
VKSFDHPGKAANVHENTASYTAGPAVASNQICSKVLPAEEPNIAGDKTRPLAGQEPYQIFL